MAYHLSDTGFLEDVRSRFAGASVIVIVIFSILFGRVWYLQIFNGRKFKQFSQSNRIKINKIPALRGRILDRNGVVLTNSRASFDLTLTRAHLKEPAGAALDHLATLLTWDDMDRDYFIRKVNRGNPNDAVVIKRDLTSNELALILSRQYSLTGVDVIHAPARSYPFGNSGSHLMGYLGQISKPQLRRLREKGNTHYESGDVWGISGVEKSFESILRGTNGANPVVEDAWGRKLGDAYTSDLLPGFRPREAIPGKDLVLSIDSRLQEVAQEAFTYPVGAVVALDPNNGDVLALVSRPEFHIEEFVRGPSKEYWTQLRKDPRNPLYDRSLQGVYPPASTFKIVTALAALGEGLVTLDEKVFCPGHYRIGRETKRCWKSAGHGYVDLHKAIAQSCDVFFYEMGKRLGVDNIAKYARKLGLGRKTGVAINREEKGLVPTEAWKKRVYKQRWVGGETLSVAIGQGAMQVTPIQLAVAFSTVVNGGTIYEPRIALRSMDENGKVIDLFGKKIKEQISLVEEHRLAVIRGGDAVVNEVDGTAYWRARSKITRIGGKTGTAQVVGYKSGLKIEDHAWFVGFAPVARPEIVVVVIVEHGGHGSSTASPIAKKIIETYLGETS